MRRIVLVCAAACAACGGGSNNNGNDAHGPGSDARVIDGPRVPDAMPADANTVAPFCTPKSGTNLKLTLITDQVAEPIGVTAPIGDPRLFIQQKDGNIRIVKNGQLLATPFLTVPANSDGLEEGLLGLAFHPNFAQNGRFFVLYNRAGMFNLRLAEYHANPTSDVADTTEKVILDIDKLADNSNGGSLAFGNDGDLYASTGDGGGNYDFYMNGQNPQTLLAKILRIDIDHGDPYSIPADNPWANDPTKTKEMWAWGLRNPWRMTIDRQTGDIWWGDVGEGTNEEIDVERHGVSGNNYGWSVFEGPDCNHNNPDCVNPQNYTFPAMTWNRTGVAGGCAVVLGGVYRGACMPDLDGQVFFGDYCEGFTKTFPASNDVTPYSNVYWHQEADPGSFLYGKMVSIGFDGYGEMYAVAMQGNAVYRYELQ